MKIDSQGGVQYQAPEDIKRAEKNGLITIPLKLQHGINCSNCEFFRAMNDHVGHCAHVDVQLPVTGSQCCNNYDSPGTLKSWEHREPEV